MITACHREWTCSFVDMFSIILLSNAGRNNCWPNAFHCENISRLSRTKHSCAFPDRRAIAMRYFVIEEAKLLTPDNDNLRTQNFWHLENEMEHDNIEFQIMSQVMTWRQSSSKPSCLLNEAIKTCIDKVAVWIPLWIGSLRGLATCSWNSLSLTLYKKSYTSFNMCSMW